MASRWHVRVWPAHGPFVSWLYFCCCLALAADPEANVSWMIARSQTGERPTAFFVDPAGNNYLAGASASVLFLEKRDSAGRLVWNRRISFLWESTQGSGTPKSIAAAAEEHVYLLGEFRGTIRFQPDPAQAREPVLLRSSDGMVFLAKYDAAGQILWVKQFQGASGRAIVVNASTNFFWLEPPTGAANLPARNIPFTFASCDQTGQLLWGQNVGASSRHLAVDPAGNSYLAASFSWRTTLYSTSWPGRRADEPGIAITTQGHSDIVLCKYDPSGRLMWFNHLGGRESDNATGLATDAAGNVYLAGRMGALPAFNFTGTNVATAVGLDFATAQPYEDFIAKYDSSGRLVWFKHGLGGDLAPGFGVVASLFPITPRIASDAAGHLYRLGLIGITNSSGSRELSGFTLSKHDPDGNLVWQQKTGSKVTAVAFGIDDRGRSYVAGEFSYRGSIGSAPLTNAWGFAAFVARLGEPSPRLRVARTGTHVLLSWSDPAKTFTLESAVELSPDDRAWAPVPTPPNVSAEHNSVSIAFAGQSRFFRLRKR